MFLNKVEICGVNTSELPLLSDEEKENLFIQIEQGNMDAREQYVKGNLRLVLSVIQRFSSNHEHADDLFQVGCIGLMKAIDNFDRTLNVKFSTYAVRKFPKKRKFPRKILFMPWMRLPPPCPFSNQSIRTEMTLCF